MRRLSSIILLLLVLSVSLSAQKSPHGKNFTANCGDCHKTAGWTVDVKTTSFNHNGTKFPLIGQHLEVNCKDCHTSLEFAKAETECIACHTDMHEQTVGNDCARCHTPNSWVVTNITQLHQLSRFPLIGAHPLADCRDCHKNLVPSSPSSPTASLLRFDPLGIECIDCHRSNYIAAVKPNHVEGKYSTNCTDCHKLNAFTWTGAGINHEFFPLVKGHAINDCSKCHTSGSYGKISSDCISCHQPDYASTTNPNHTALHFSTNCIECHTLNPGWKPAEYREHDAGSFPIYSGNHKGEWNSCADCHTNPANYSQFTCISCHEHSNKAETDNKHEGVNGYTYTSTSCYGCHPNGTADGLKHNYASFPLTGGHATPTCADCHSNGYTGTSNVCSNCHQNKYNQTINPNHNTVGISTDCGTCHTTNPGWQPATFPTHNTYYVIAGAHVSKPCADCHKGNYTTTPNTCAGCHTANYNQTTNPNHTSSKFPTTCEVCHSQSAWAPATFNHNTVYPLLGAHAKVAANCALCHANGYSNTPNTCEGCHIPDFNQTTNPNHTTSQFPKTCETCHSQDAWVPATFNHNTVYPLTGAHATAANNCSLCHANGYSNTPNTCAGCHQNNFNQSANPNHKTLGISTDCAICHTTNPGWEPATFPTHNNYYVLAGAHISKTCASCHNGNYTTTPNTCAGCHTTDYNQTSNPNHTSAQFPKTCADCHSQSSWTPSTWNHDTQDFPIYSGKHQGEWNICADCHKTAGNYKQFSCIDCHEHNQTDMNSKHKGINNYSWNSASCYSCHPKGNNN